MNYQETLDYLFSQLPMFSRVGAAAYKKDIYNTVALCESLGNPQNKFKSIHIAGTNGKGSTSHMLAAVFQENGYKTGLYTSPHLKEFGERIRINGQMIDPNFVINFTEKTKSLCKSIQPSFFELTVAMAFEYFAIHEVDIAIIETGLGGRLDSTNIIQPILSVITNIGFDHTHLLGNTISDIAAEKAGIIKNNTPVVIGETTPETKIIFEEKAKSTDSEIIYAEDNFEISIKENNAAHIICNVTDKSSDTTALLSSDLNGEYQTKNIRTVLTALKKINSLGFNLYEAKTKTALSHVKKRTGLKGRWDIISTTPTIILDVAHNKDGIQMVLNQLSTTYQNKKIHFVLGFVNDKDIDAILEMLPKNAKYYFTNAHIERALPHHELKVIAKNKGLEGISFDHINDAILDAKKNADQDDIIMVCGSFFTLAEIDEDQII